MKEEFKVGDVCEAWYHPDFDAVIGVSGWIEVTLSHRNASGDWAHDGPYFSGEYAVTAEAYLRKKKPPEQKDTQVAEDDFIDDFKKLIERQEEPA